MAYFSWWFQSCLPAGLEAVGTSALAQSLPSQLGTQVSAGFSPILTVQQSLLQELQVSQRPGFWRPQSRGTPLPLVMMTL